MFCFLFFLFSWLLLALGFCWLFDSVGYSTYRDAGFWLALASGDLLLLLLLLLAVVVLLVVVVGWVGGWVGGGGGGGGGSSRGCMPGRAGFEIFDMKF